MKSSKQLEEITVRQLVREFSREMREKLLVKTGDGWSGWNTEGFQPACREGLAIHLVRALDGDAAQWVDVANFAAFLWWMEARGKEGRGG